MFKIAFVSFVAFVAFVPFVPSAEQKLKVHISVDMEGVAGAVTAEQLGPTGFEVRPLP